MEKKLRLGVASQSFTAEEIALLDQLLRGLLRNADVRVLVKHSAFASVLRKTQAMQKRIAFLQMQALSGKPPAEEAPAAEEQ